MDQSSEISNDIYIKMEPQDDSEFPGTSHESCLNYYTNVETDEPIIKLKCENMNNEISEDPLDIDGAIKDADEGIEENPPSEPKEDIKYNVEESEKFVLTSNEEFKSLKKKGSKINNKNQSLEENKKIGKNNVFICHICEQICICKSHLDIHLRTHTGEKPFSCHICKRSFSVKNSLDRHMFIHSVEKPHACDVCQKVFNQKSSLDKHKRIHSGLKPYSCDECDKSFRQSHHLTKHKLLHTGNRPFVCEFCNKAFTTRSYLIGHRRLHTGEKPFTCDICNKSFGLKYHLKNHTKLHEKKTLHNL